ncbi:MAG: tRNA uridine-5-carboxymethylaminomethyl(34) synthesis GTPase MnmE [Ruminococcaceae bacterium]|nr:tRNA uridine-5-carboxymethylaminomethyl(34) synthesis GTPase MnmE [Oscillospiraceae bacterium]
MFETIAAVSTPRGKGGIAVIRVSGDGAAEIAARVFSADLTAKPPRTAVYGKIYAPLPDGGREVVDDGVAVLWRGPNSYTGEDVLEISCHGGVLVTQAVLEAVLAAGARMAQAGEFTRRAFLNGRLGLGQAEAVGALLEAKTRSQLALSRGGMGGRLGARCAEIAEQLRSVAVSCMAAIDFPDEDLREMSREEMISATAEAVSGLRTLAATWRTGRAVAEGIPTVLCGRANVGKSALYNRLVGRDAAIVTAIAGTTRDMLTETVEFGGVTLRLTDTAGLRDTEDPVEAIGVGRARNALAEAELVLVVFDGASALDEDDDAMLALLPTLEAETFVLANQADRGLLPETVERLRTAGKPVAVISAETGEGMDALAAAVTERFLDGSLDLREDAIVTGARQYAALMRSAEAAEAALTALRDGMPEDLCCVDLELALGALDEVDGRAVSEDIVGEIFSRFCVGK